jgi:hypothetical protein
MKDIEGFNDLKEIRVEELIVKDNKSLFKRLFGIFLGYRAAGGIGLVCYSILHN